MRVKLNGTSRETVLQFETLLTDLEIIRLKIKKTIKGRSYIIEIFFVHERVVPLTPMASNFLRIYHESKQRLRD